MATRVLSLAFLFVPLSAQAFSSFQDLAQELASKVAAAVAPANQVTLTILTAEDDPAALLPVEAEIRRTLAAGGIRTIDGDAAPAIVRVGCTRNLRERVCVAEIRQGAARSVAVVTRPLEPREEPATSVLLELIPIFSQRAQILDVAISGDRLLVLDPERLTLYERLEKDGEAFAARGDRTGGEASAGRDRWKQLHSNPIARSRPWPRDVRGRLRVEGGAVTAWLPGVACRGATDLVRFSCTDERGTSWPIDIENTGVDAARNYFNTPEGLPFYAAAPLGMDAGARWLVVGNTGELLLLDAARRTVASVASGNDVVALESACGRLLVVAASTSNASRSEMLRSFRVIKGQLIPAAAPLELPGRLTALWPLPEATAATAIVHDASREVYVASHIRTACSR
jgi:hypothetical protein